MSAQFVAKYADHGFDGSIAPPWLLVETGYYNYARLKVTGDGKNWKLATANKGIATAKFRGTPETSGGFAYLDVVVTAQGKGSTYVTASNSSTSSTAKIEVQVTPALDVYVNFHLVTDSRGIRTKRSAADIKILVDKMSNVYEWQANAYFYLHQCQDVTIKMDFATKNQSEDAQKKLWKAMSKAAQKLDAFAGHLNIFCVRDWGARDKTNSDVIGTNLRGGNLGIIEDKTDFLTVAHELGHGLTLRHRESVPKALMYYMDEDGKRIYKDEATQLRIPDHWASWG